MNTQPPGRVRFARQDDLLCIRLEGRITFALAPAFTDFIGHIFARDDWKGIIVDLTATTSIDSTNLGLLAKIARLLRQRRDQSLVVISANERINATLHSVGLERLMTIVPPAGPAIGGGLADLPPGDASRDAQTRVILEAHRELMALNEKNAAQFRTVVEYLGRETPE